MEKFFSGLLSAGACHKLELIEAHGHGKLLYGTAKWSATGKDAAGKYEPWGGVATHVFEKGASGKLKIKLHTSTELACSMQQWPPPGDAWIRSTGGRSYWRMLNRRPPPAGRAG